MKHLVGKLFSVNKIKILNKALLFIIITDKIFIHS